MVSKNKMIRVQELLGQEMNLLPPSRNNLMKIYKDFKPIIKYYSEDFIDRCYYADWEFQHYHGKTTQELWNNLAGDLQYTCDRMDFGRLVRLQRQFYELFEKWRGEDECP